MHVGTQCYCSPISYTLSSFFSHNLQLILHSSVYKVIIINKHLYFRKLKILSKYYFPFKKICFIIGRSGEADFYPFTSYVMSPHCQVLISHLILLITGRRELHHSRYTHIIRTVVFERSIALHCVHKRSKNITFQWLCEF